MNRIAVSVVIPTYNERDNIVRIIEDLRRELASVSHEIIIVDDNSPDGTGKTVRARYSYNSGVRCFVSGRRLGLAASILLGIRKSHGTIIVGMDADGNHSPALVPSLIRKLPAKTLRTASRYVHGGGMAPLPHYLASMGMNVLFSLLLGREIRDWTSGCMAIHRSDLIRLPLAAIYRGYGEYFMKLMYHARRKGMRIEEYPAFFPKRKFGKSKSRWLSMADTYLQTAWNLRNT